MTGTRGSAVVGHPTDKNVFFHGAGNGLWKTTDAGATWLAVGDKDFFLLFATNLVGIILASAFTFRILGYSAAVRGKRGIGIVTLFLALISVPLYLSYDRIVEKRAVESGWRNERFLVNGKYLIIQKARLSRSGDKEVIVMDILAREQLTRADLTLFKEKIQNNFTRKLIIRAKIIYIP